MSGHPIVDAICAGTPRPFRGEEKSAFAKVPIDGPVAFSADGIGGDEQADPIHHGGPHMAVHLYPHDHHAFWHDELGGHELLDLPGAFGSNLSITGIDERQVHLGDRFRLGTALLEVSQPRMPCWKIEHRFQRKRMVATIIETARCGWYFRVIESGEAQAGDALERVAGQATDWTIADLMLGIANPKTAIEAGELRAMAACELLGPAWRDGAGKKAEALAG